MKSNKKHHAGCGTILGLVTIYGFIATMAVSALYYLLIKPVIYLL